MESCSRSPEGLDFLASHLTREHFDRVVKYDWCVNGRDDQLAPVLAKGGGRWHTWLVLGGRGSGKTRTGAEWIRAQVAGEPPLADRRSHRIALRRAYVIGDRTVQGREPTVWTKAAVAAYHDHEADTIVVETNQGVDLLVQMFKSIDVRVPVKKVYASRGKFLRAEPVSGLYNEGRVVHVGTFPELEHQMCDFAADGLAHGKSPDRLDALVWAITELMLTERREPRFRTL